MLHTRRIRDLEEMRNQAFPPPYALMELLEDADGRGEAWWVLMAFEGQAAEARWVAVFPDAGESRFYSDGEQMSGRWDGERGIFLPEEGPPQDLRGNTVSLRSIAEDEEEEDAEDQKRTR